MSESESMEFMGMRRKGPQLKEVTKVRTLFPETWLWQTTHTESVFYNVIVDFHQWLLFMYIPLHYIVRRGMRKWWVNHQIPLRRGCWVVFLFPMKQALGWQTRNPRFGNKNIWICMCLLVTFDRWYFCWYFSFLDLASSISAIFPVPRSSIFCGQRWGSCHQSDRF